MIDDGDPEAIAFQPADLQEVRGIDVVRGARVARISLGVATVQVVLHVAAADEPALPAAGDDDTARLARILADGVITDLTQLVGGHDHQPPASAGMIATSSPSFTGVCRPARSSIA